MKPELVSSRFSAAITEARKSKGLSQRSVAKMAGVSSTLISMLERRRCTVPTDSTLCRLAAAIGITPDEIFALVERVPPDIREIMVSNPRLYAPMLRMARMSDDDSVRRVTEHLRESIGGNGA